MPPRAREGRRSEGARSDGQEVCVASRQIAVREPARQDDLPPPFERCARASRSRRPAVAVFAEDGEGRACRPRKSGYLSGRSAVVGVVENCAARCAPASAPEARSLESSEAPCPRSRRTRRGRPRARSRSSVKPSLFRRPPDEPTFPPSSDPDLRRTRGSPVPVVRARPRLFSHDVRSTSRRLRSGDDRDGVADRAAGFDAAARGERASPFVAEQRFGAAAARESPRAALSSPRRRRRIFEVAVVAKSTKATRRREKVYAGTAPWRSRP